MPRFDLRTVTAGLVFMMALETADAAVIVQHQEAGMIGGEVVGHLFAFEPFDPALGELNEAVFSATVMLTYTAGTNMLPTPGGPLPIEVSGTVDLQLYGTNWLFGFSAICDVHAFIPAGQSENYFLSVDIRSQSSALANQLGFTRIDGEFESCRSDQIDAVQLGDYLAAPPVNDDGLLTQFASLWSVQPTPGLFVSGSTGGVVATLQYDYTPHALQPAPEPVSGLLLGFGLACLGMRRRKHP